jgi:hypothetical protein
MRRRVRWLVIVAVVAVLGVIATGVLIGPDLGEARDRVDARWTPLRPALAQRYEALAIVTAAMHDAGAGERSVTQDLDEALRRWSGLARRGPGRADAALEAQSANELEALARRLRANIAGSDRLATNATLTETVLAFDQAVVPVPAVQTYNRAARRYERERSGAIERFVAAVLGYESRPLLVVGG